MAASRDNTEELALEDLVPVGKPADGPRREGVLRPSTPPPPPPGARPVTAGPASTAARSQPDAPAVSQNASAPADPSKAPAEAQARVRARSEATTPPSPSRQYIRQPAQRLWRVYWVTCQVVFSYSWIQFRSFLQADETIQRLTERAHRRNARRIRNAIVDLQGLFIKVGQLISIMANFLPEAFRRELEELQDKVPPRPYEDIEERLIEEFQGRGPEQVFRKFDRTPIASASIGQVHVAELHSGEKVAVKVQYPDIEAIVNTDLKALRRIFWVLRWMMPSWGFDTIYREIREMVLAELDYVREAEAMQAIAANFVDRDDVRIPGVIADRSTMRVLTTEWIQGCKVADLPALDALGVDRKKVAHLFVDAYCQQIFVDGNYHADPHPGNLLVERLPDGRPRIVFLDFGATAHLSEQMRRGMLNFLQGAATRDTGRLVAAMKEMGFISRRADPEVFDRVVEYFHERLRAEVLVEGFSLKDIRFDPQQKLESILDLREMNVSLGDLRDAFHVPGDWVMLERALLLLLGVCTTLDPEMNPSAVIKPYLERFLLGEKEDFSDAAMEATREAALAVLALPGELRRILSRAEQGQLQVVVSNIGDGAHLIYTGAQQVLWGFLGATATSLAVVFDGRGQERGRFWAEVAAVIFGLMLGRSLLGGRRRSRRSR